MRRRGHHGDRTLAEDLLAWTLEQFEKGKLPAMIECLARVALFGRRTQAPE